MEQPHLELELRPPCNERLSEAQGANATEGKEQGDAQGANATVVGWGPGGYAPWWGSGGEAHRLRSNQSPRRSLCVLRLVERVYPWAETAARRIVEGVFYRYTARWRPGLDLIPVRIWSRRDVPPVRIDLPGGYMALLGTYAVHTGSLSRVK